MVKERKKTRIEATTQRRRYLWSWRLVWTKKKVWCFGGNFGAACNSLVRLISLKKKSGEARKSLASHDAAQALSGIRRHLLLPQAATSSAADCGGAIRF